MITYFPTSLLKKVTLCIFAPFLFARYVFVVYISFILLLIFILIGTCHSGFSLCNSYCLFRNNDVIHQSPAQTKDIYKLGLTPLKTPSTYPM